MSELKSKLKHFSSVKGSSRISTTPLGADSSFTPRNTSVFASPSMSTSSCQVGSALEDSYIQQINSLKRVISLLRHHNHSLVMQENLKKLSLVDCYHRQTNDQLLAARKEEITRLRKEISSLERKSASLLLGLRVNQMSSKEKREIGLQSAKLTLEMNSLRSQLNHLIDPLGQSGCHNLITAKLTVPCDHAKPLSTNIVPITVSLSQLKKLQASLLQ